MPRPPIPFRFIPLLRYALVFGVLQLSPIPALAQRQVEYLDRGLIAVGLSDVEVMVGWRMLGTDPLEVAFNLYRSTAGGPDVKLNDSPLTTSTSFFDQTVDRTKSNTYRVEPVIAAVARASTETFTLPAGPSTTPWLEVPLQIPAGGTTPLGDSYTYSANDCSVGDLDGDGAYEIIVKWDPSNSKDNSQSGYTGKVLLDAYRLDGTRLWRIDLGPNIRAGAHYTQFQVFDLDGDGRAELACRTAEGSLDGLGRPIADASRFTGDRPAIDHDADRRNSNGYILSGPEFLTLFDGLTGAELTSTLYAPQRVDGTFFPTTQQIKNGWGDDYGNRVDRFLAGVAYLDGQRPSLIVSRGYYTRTAVAAYDWRDGVLTRRWVFDTNPADGSNEFAAYRGQGNHQLAVGDVDSDGRDEIVFGACTIDDNGRGLYSTGLGHGDALHLSDHDPRRPGLEVFGVHENTSEYGAHGSGLRDALTGELIFSVSGEGTDVGRGVSMDIDPRHVGNESWASRGGLHTCTGELISSRRPSPMNFAVWWDGDLLREFLDGTTISKWSWIDGQRSTLLEATGCASNNSTKANPSLSADLLGDWREEVIWRTTDSSALRIYTTTAPTTHRMPTLMHDPMYRTAIAWQNTGYNQPPHPGFYLGEDMEPRAAADIRTTRPAASVDAELANLSVRTYGGTGDETLTLGFVIEGSSPRPLLARGIGPTLADFGVAGTMPDPTITLFQRIDGSMTTLTANDNWTSSTDLASLRTAIASAGAFALLDPSGDAALTRSLSAGAYTLQITPQDSTPGIALAELYPLTPDSGTRLVNASSRALAGTGDETLIVGFVLTGTTPRKLLVRAVGPTLGTFGVNGTLANPRLDIFRSTPDGSIHLAGNDDWTAGSGVSAQTFARLGAFDLGPQSQDAVLLLNLTPGVYTAHCSSGTGARGVALIELYVLDEPVAPAD